MTNETRQAGSPTALATATGRFAAQVLRVFLVGGFGVTALTAGVVVTSAPGPHPVRRLALLAALIVAWGAAWWRAHELTAAVGRAARRRHSWPVLVLMLILVAAFMAVLIFDGEGRASPLSDQQYILISIAVIVGGGGVLAGTWLALIFGFICISALGVGNRALFSQAAFADLISTTSAAVVAGVLFIVWRRTTDGIPERLEQLRIGAPAFTSELSRAITAPPQLRALPPPHAVLNAQEDLSAAHPRARLDAEERHVVDRLGEGDAPKQIAHETKWSLPKVRKRIATAKRKTDARTLAELVKKAARSKAKTKPEAEPMSEPVVMAARSGAEDHCR